MKFLGAMLLVCLAASASATVYLASPYVAGYPAYASPSLSYAAPSLSYAVGVPVNYAYAATAPVATIAAAPAPRSGSYVRVNTGAASYEYGLPLAYDYLKK